jgi:hypothetical protein
MGGVETCPGRCPATIDAHCLKKGFEEVSKQTVAALDD